MSNFSEKILILENVRFYPEVEENNLEFSKKLASLGDIYVNDAFSCSHRKHSSISGITNFVPSYAGLHMIKEINALSQITKNIKKQKIRLIRTNIFLRLTEVACILFLLIQREGI